MAEAPTSASWINQVERWFAELAKKRLRRGVHTSVRQLEADIRESSNAAVTSATTLTAAENAAVATLAGRGVAYFVYKGNEYFIATNNLETTVSTDDAIVKLVGVTDIHHATNSSGLVTLHV